MIRELTDKYLFQKMVVNQSDSEVEEELTDGTFIISYRKDGEEIGIGLKKCEDGPVVKCFQVLTKPTFARQITMLSPLEAWQKEQEKA